MSNEVVQIEENQKVDALEQSPARTESSPASQNQTDQEAMRIFREVSKKHHSLWVSLAKP